MRTVETTSTFRGQMLCLGRQARRATQADLATNSGVTQAFVSLVEEDQRLPSDEQLQAFAKALGFPVAFFHQPDAILGTGVGEIFHRRKKLIPAKDLDQIHAWMNIMTFAIRRLLRSVDWPAVDMPSWSLGVDVDTEEDAAEMLRAKWYVPSGPIRSVSGLLDYAGVLVVPIDFGSSAVDGIGQWSSDLPPMIFANTNLLQDRLRFTLMHELGHLLVHQRSWLQAVSGEIEDEANKFAAAMLMPKQEIRPQLRDLTMAKLASLKRHWRVSMSAILMRASQLNTITPAEEKKLWIEMGRNGWRKREPIQLDIFGEEPGSRYRELIHLFRQELGYSDRELARILHLGEDDIRNHIRPSEAGLRIVG